MRYPLDATQLADVKVPQLPASRCAVLQPSVQLGPPTGGQTSSRAFCGTTIGPVLVQRTYSHVRFSTDQKNYSASSRPGAHRLSCDTHPNTVHISPHALPYPS